jgi:tetratricopeptide (TPR) repeat protein
MKKIILIGFMFLSVTITFGQKGKVSDAYNMVLMTPPDFEAAKTSINEALANPSTKDWVKTWYTAGYVYEKIIEDQQKKEIFKNDDKKVRGEAIVKAYDYFVKAYDLDQQPDEKGKVKPKYAKEITTYMKTYPVELFNYGINLYNDKEYEKTITVWKKYLEMPNLSFLKDAGIEKDSAYIKATYYTATTAVIIQDPETAIKYFEQVKDKYQVDKSYQYLAQQYLAKKDTVGYFNTIKLGFDKYPKNPYFLESLINYYILFNGKIDDAIVYIDKAIAMNPQISQYYYVKANLFETKGMLDDAITNYQKTLEIDKQNTIASTGMGRCYYKKGDEALRNADATKDPKLAKVESDKATGFYKQGIASLEKTREINPKDIDNLKLLRSLYYKISKDANNPNYIKVNNEIKNLEN